MSIERSVCGSRTRVVRVTGPHTFQASKAHGTHTYRFTAFTAEGEGGCCRYVVGITKYKKSRWGAAARGGAAKLTV